MKISMRVNNNERELEMNGQTPLLWVLRDELNMTGTKYGCGKAQCGACTVHLNGNAVRSCVTPISAVNNSSVTTIEGIDNKTAAAVMKAWKSLDVPQCGFVNLGK